MTKIITDDGKTIDLNQYCKASEIAAYHGVSVKRVYQWIESDYLDGVVRIGKSIWVNRQAAQDYVRRPPGQPGHRTNRFESSDT